MIKDLAIEVVYALELRQTRLLLSVPPGSTVAEAIRLSGLLSYQPEIDMTRNKFGVFGGLVHPDTPVHAGDRIEIYRPLAADPREARRRRVRTAKRRD